MRRGSTGAAVHAASLVDANLAFAFEFQLGDPVLGVGLRPGSAEIVATRFSIRALVAAEKHVVFVVAHVGFLG